MGFLYILRYSEATLLDYEPWMSNFGTRFLLLA